MVYRPLNPFLELIWKNFISLIRLVDYRTILTCFAITIVLWPLIWTGFIQPTKHVLEIAAVAVTALFSVGLVVRFALTRHLFLLVDFHSNVQTTYAQPLLKFRDDTCGHVLP